jgi:tetratricopeptide (TPR) repeat protein
VELVAGNRSAEAMVLALLAQLTAMAGRIDDARDLARRGLELVADLGPSSLVASLSDHTSRVEVLAGDLRAAEVELRRDYGVLEAMDEVYTRSTISALLGQVLWAQGRYDEAIEFTHTARELADSDDLYSQVLWRSVEAKNLAKSGQGETGIELATEALAMLDATVDIELRADILIDLAETLRLAGRQEEGGPHIREALQLYRQKGDVILAAAAADRLSSLEGLVAT